MTDAEMIEWLKDQAGRRAWAGHDTCRAIAARLAALTAPPPDGPPVTDGRLAEIERAVRQIANVAAVPSSEEAPLAEEVLPLLRDLRSRLDWNAARALIAECAVADLLAEDDRYERGKAAGLAMAIQAVVEHRGRLRHSWTGDATQRVDTENGMDLAAHVIERAGDSPASLLPHEQALAENRRLRADLREVARRALTDGSECTYEAIARFARAALGEDAP